MEERNQLRTQVKTLERELAQVRAESAFQRERAATSARKSTKLSKELRAKLEEVQTLQAQHQALVEKSNAAALDLLAEFQKQGSAALRDRDAARAANDRLQQRCGSPFQVGTPV